MKKFLPRNIKRYNRQIPGNTKLTPEDAENMSITVQPVKSVVKQRRLSLADMAEQLVQLILSLKTAGKQK